MSIVDLIVSVILSVVVVQAAALIIGGLLNHSGAVADRFAAILALPMTLVFFGVPALVIAAALIVSGVYALEAAGLTTYAPAVMALLGVGWIGAMAVIKPRQHDPMAGYRQVLRLNAAAALIIWAIYAFQWLDLGDLHG